MFAKEKTTKIASEFSREQNKIAPGTKIKGDIEAKGGFRIDGTVEGSITTPGKVVIGKEGAVHGNITCENADIEGKLYGKAKVSGTLSLRSTAYLEGEAVVTKFAVEPGAVFNATCTMRGGIKAINNERGGGQEEKSA